MGRRSVPPLRSGGAVDPRARLRFRADAGYVAGARHRRGQGARGGRRSRGRGRGRAGPRVRRRRTGCRSSARTARGAQARLGLRCSACVGCTGRDGRPARARAVQQRLPRRFRPRRCAGPHAWALRPWSRTTATWRLSPSAGRAPAQGLDDIVCVLAGERIGAGIMVGGTTHARACGRGGGAGVPRRVRGGARRARHRPARARARPARRPRTCSPRPARATQAALAIVERAERWAATGIVTTAQIVNPEVVVISGGVARAGEVLLAPLRARLEAMVRLPPRLEASPLAERGPLLGAIRLALDDTRAAHARTGSRKPPSAPRRARRGRR